MKFSERYGFKEKREIFQEESMDKDLRISLWNVLHVMYLKVTSFDIFSEKMENFKILIDLLWLELLKKPLDEISTRIKGIHNQIKDYFLYCEWHEVYDFIEFTANNYPDENINKQFMDNCNTVLKRELSAYRFVGKQLVKITSEEEISEIEEALKMKGVFMPVSQHLKNALELLSNRKNPDYKNSIKESISAVEAMCKLITGVKKATLGDALKQIEKKGTIKLHPALKIAFDKLYGYTSDAKGIRHGSGILDEEDLDFEDAKFMFVSCSAFNNYLKEKVNKAQIKINPLK